MQKLIFFVVLFSLSGIFFSLFDSFAQTIISPHQQWKEQSSIDQITCKDGLVLLQKSNGIPACVSPSSYLKLIDRGYAIFDSKILMDRPVMMNNIMKTMTENNDLMHHWHEMMINDSNMMKNTIKDWIQKMKDNPAYLANIMGPITSDPELRQKMVEYMRQHTTMEQSLKDHQRWMESVHDQKMEHETHQGVELSKCSWCPQYEQHVMHENNTDYTNSARMMDMMHYMWINDQMTQDMHEFMLENPSHMAQMSKQMMRPILVSMMDDPELRQQMIELMLVHEEFMLSIRHENTN